MPIEIPAAFRTVRYDAAGHPQAAQFDPDKGANCQLWAYALLRHFGLSVPAFRSSELWEDAAFTEAVRDFEPLDLLLFHDAESAWGAHVAVYLGDGLVAHLSRQVGVPEVRSVEEMRQHPKYRVLVGAKRVRARV